LPRSKSIAIGESISGKVAVIGGGNVAIDVARCAARARDAEVSIYCLEKWEEMPALSDEKGTAVSDGVAIYNSWGPKRIITVDGRATGVEFMRCTRVYDEDGRFKPIFDEDDVFVAEADHVILSIGQAIDWGGMLESSAAKLDDSSRILVDSLTFQSAQPDVFAGGDAVTGPRFAIDAIAAGKQGAISIHRFVQPGQDLRLGRSRRIFTGLDRFSAIIGSYDYVPRQRAEMADADQARHTFRDVRGTLTEEQVRKETERCLSCGTTVSDEYMCVGCGMCVAQCKFDAISLTRAYSGKGVRFLSIKKAILPHLLKRKAKITIRKLLSRGAR
jgi:NADPH-dependent glutamate synthase beta subunit-like oxidoreductase